MAIDYREISKSVRLFVATIVRDSADENGFVDTNGTRVDRAVISSLALAWADAVRDELKNAIAGHPALVLDMEVAQQLLTASNSTDFVCMPAGMEMNYVMVDQKKAYVFEANMIYATPLSAIYLNNVREVMDAFKAVSAAKQAAKANGDGNEGA